MNLTPEGLAEFAEAFGEFKNQIREAAVDAIDRAITEGYHELPKYLESDFWLNYRQHLRESIESEAFAIVPKSDDVWAKEVRKRIFAEHREELIASLGRDLVEENKKLYERLEEGYRRVNF